MDPIIGIAAAAIAYTTGAGIGKIFCRIQDLKNDPDLDILDAKIAAADERIAAKQALLAQLTETCTNAHQKEADLQHQVNSWEKAINRLEN
jgi:septal ring factor EnvC (AmiA/AmiB activator)